MFGEKDESKIPLKDLLGMSAKENPALHEALAKDDPLIIDSYWKKKSKS